MFAVTGISVAALAIFELLMMTAPTAERYAVLLRWVACAVRVDDGRHRRLRPPESASRKALARVLVCVARLACLVPDFLTGENLNFIHITIASPVPIWGGGFVAAPVGVPNPWMGLGQASVRIAAGVSGRCAGVGHSAHDRRIPAQGHTDLRQHDRLSAAIGGLVCCLSSAARCMRR
jgi:hypothetical protein